MKKFKNLLLFLAHIAILGGCASYSSPTGGEKDVKPPVLVKSYPANKSVNYTNTLIELEFNEYVKVENLKQELLITPSAEGEFTTKLTKKGIRLEFDKKFTQNTTYTLNFRNAVKDITEKNIAKNLKIVFSTGNIIDSLSIRGNIKDLQTNIKVYDAVVSLYVAADTNNILNSKPYYFTRTDSSGNYALENLKNGTYKIYALQDKNSDLKFNEKNDKIGFIKGSITLDSSINNIDMKLVRIDKTAPAIIDTDVEVKKFTVEFSEGLFDLRTNVDSISKAIRYMREEANKLVFYKVGAINDTVAVKVMAIDSSDNVFNGIQKVYFAEEKKVSDKKATEKKAISKLDLQTDPKDGELIERTFQYKINFDKPIASYDLSKIKLLNDTITVQELPIKDFVWDQYLSSVKFNQTTKATREVRISIPVNTFISIDGDTNKVSITNHKIKISENFGSVGGKVETNGKSNYIIQLLTTEYKVVAELKNLKDYKFNYLTEGNYYIRIIEDQNGNGRWDSGSLKEELAPENIIYYPQAIKVKQNWDIQNINLTL